VTFTTDEIDLRTLSASFLPSDLLAARAQMALSLGFHIVFAEIGIAMPLLMVLAEWRWRRTGDDVYYQLAKRWTKGTAVLFAVGAVSGTVLSFELGLLWPEFMRLAGPIIGIPFSLEGFAFFTEAIFLGVYLYGWDRISPRAHLLAGLIVAASGAASAIFSRSPSGASSRAGHGRDCLRPGSCGSCNRGLGRATTRRGDRPGVATSGRDGRVCPHRSGDVVDAPVPRRAGGSSRSGQPDSVGLAHGAIPVPHSSGLVDPGHGGPSGDIEAAGRGSGHRSGGVAPVTPVSVRSVQEGKGRNMNETCDVRGSTFGVRVRVQRSKPLLALRTLNREQRTSNGASPVRA
jgi:hypothetical protein